MTGTPPKPKNKAAAALGRRRMEKLTPEERKELAQKAAAARWPKPPAK